MAIIELNVEKPALKRVESMKEQRTKDEGFGTTTGTTETSTGMTEMTGGGTASGEMTTGEISSGETASGETTMEETSQQTESGGKSRTRKYGRRLAMVAGTAAGAAAVRKLRQRRKSKGQQQELEEDWQTAE
jgi:hypothetical protein